MLTTPEVAEKLRVQPETIRKWARQGKIKAMKVGRGFLFDEKDVYIFMATHKVG